MSNWPQGRWTRVSPSDATIEERDRLAAITSALKMIVKGQRSASDAARLGLVSTLVTALAAHLASYARPDAEMLMEEIDRTLLDEVDRFRAPAGDDKPVIWQ